MGNLWMSYLLAGSLAVFWVANIIGQTTAQKLYKKLCPDPLPSEFSLNKYTKIKGCLFNLDLEKLTPKDINKIDKIRLATKIQYLSFFIVIALAVVAFAKQGFKFV